MTFANKIILLCLVGINLAMGFSLLYAFAFRKDVGENRKPKKNLKKNNSKVSPFLKITHASMKEKGKGFESAFENSYVERIKSFASRNRFYRL